MSFFTGSEAGLDTNGASNTTATFDVMHISRLDWSVRDTTGTHAAHIISLQTSNDQANWDDLDSMLGTGTNRGILVLSRYIRWIVSNAEGAESTVSIEFSGK